jgi:glycosyltransferase involved in cell wall biosynthesis
VTFEYVDVPTYVPWERAAGGSLVGPAVSYYLFQLKSYARARRLLRERSFDIAHHITIANFRFPSLLPFLPAPTVLGPLGGGEDVPDRLRVVSSYGGARRMSLTLARRDPILANSLRRARRLLVANLDTAQRLGWENQSKVELMTYGFDLGEVPDPVTRPDRHGDVTILCVSRLVQHKGIELLVRAVPAIASELSGKVRVLVFGAGRETGPLIELARRIGAEPYLEMHSRVERHVLLRMYAQSDIFCLPSLRDTCPVALLEAMASGLPAVVLDHSGPGLIVGPECGVLVKPTTLDETVSGIAGAICRLGKDDDLRAVMGRAARERVGREFRWDDRGDRLARIYGEVTSLQESREHDKWKV